MWINYKQDYRSMRRRWLYRARTFRTIGNVTGLRLAQQAMVNLRTFFQNTQSTVQ